MAPWLAFEFIPLVVIFTFFRGLENTSPSTNSDDVNQYFIFYCGRQKFNPEMTIFCKEIRGFLKLF